MRALTAGADEIIKPVEKEIKQLCGVQEWLSPDQVTERHDAQSKLADQVDLKLLEF